MEIDLYDYDIDAIRDYLMDYYGTAMVSSSPFATVDLIDVESKSDYEILLMAINMGVNINNFLNHKNNK